MTVFLNQPAKTALVLNGDLSQPDLAVRLNQYDAIYCADGAYDTVSRLPVALAKIKAVLGDGDSLAKRAAVSVPFVVLPDQSYTDTYKSLAYLIEQGESSVDVYGASGRQQDHFLGNMAALQHFSNKLRLKCFDTWSVYLPLPKQCRVEGVQKGAKCSLVPWPCATGVSAAPLQYGVNGLDFSFSGSLGLRNVALSHVLEITYQSGSLWLWVALKEKVESQ